ncbi:pirin family protein [Aestuariicoccus sp. MJ-SS9]|uniref:pirin family protein n=1 Tax=Aestuariicoccus sp. MJ-SS9 TaxID=3079855 RepID=UPI002907218C|nr:pirin family protein [Aestuariicoccus sp. MJ-SS9]MDU8913994.1 pirin family protein [Aestuariicoccus sp. MJ-SS9]
MTQASSALKLDQVILPSVKDLGGGFEIRRALPSPQRQMVGPFIFLDAFGPAVFRGDEEIDVRPHPHIGLSTVTYLIEGSVVHRDSEGYSQAIEPGAVNMMTAGRGIVHSERGSAEFRKNGGSIFGFQTWLALPNELEETDPGFQHVAATEIPRDEGDGISMSLLAGALNGHTSPTKVFAETLYADLSLAAGARYKLDTMHIERAIYVVSGSVEIVGQDGSFGKDQLVVFQPHAEIIIKAESASRLMVLGGEPFSEKRYIFWNFVSSSRERIEQAAEDWRERRFPGIVGDDEFIPLPDEIKF